MFEPDAPASVMLVHGPGGIGKSVLLREFRRRGVAAGWVPFALDGRDLPPLPDAVEQALAGAWTTDRPLVLIDSYEHMSALGAYLRSTLLPSLPANAVVVIAGREAPEPGWFEGGWETVAVELPLAAFTEHEARALLERHGLEDDPRASAIARWAGGLPLALRLGAAAARRIRRGRPGRTRRRCGRICSASPTWRWPGSSPTCSRSPASRGRHARADRGRAPGNRRRDRAALARGLRVLRRTRGRRRPARPGPTPLRAALRASSPERERDLRARVADSLHARALAGDLALTIDLADLVVDRRCAPATAGTAASTTTSRARGPSSSRPATKPRRTSTPSRATCSSPATPTASRAATRSRSPPTPRRRSHSADPRLGPWLAHARGREAIVWRDSVSLRPGRTGAAEHGDDPALRPAQPALRVSADRPALARGARVQRRRRRAARAGARRRRLGMPRARRRARWAARPRSATSSGASSGSWSPRSTCARRCATSVARATTRCARGCTRPPSRHSAPRSTSSCSGAC